jgi:hypothetical protein
MTDDLVPPSSSRMARPLRDELPLDDGLPGVLDPDALPAPESVERPPASRKLTSVRAPVLDHDVEDFSKWEIDGEATEPPSTPNGGRPTMPAVDMLTADVVRRTLPETELVVLVSSTRTQRPATFGELLDLALELGD